MVTGRRKLKERLHQQSFVKPVLLLGTSAGGSTLVRNFNRKAVLLLETSTGRQQGGAAFAKVFNRDIVLLLRTSLTGGFALVRNFNREVIFLLRTSVERL